MTAAAALPPVTDWFPGDVKPARPGVYERDLPHEGVAFARWTGLEWRCGRLTVSGARREKFRSIYPPGMTRWRGLSADPAAPQSRHVHETWAEAVARVPALAEWAHRPVAANMSAVFDLIDTRPGYQLQTFVGGVFVFRRAEPAREVDHG